MNFRLLAPFGAAFGGAAGAALGLLGGGLALGTYPIGSTTVPWGLRRTDILEPLPCKTSVEGLRPPGREARGFH